MRELTMTARMRDPGRQQVPLAEQHRRGLHAILREHTAAAAGSSATIRPRSSAGGFRRPQFTAAKRKPRGSAAAGAGSVLHTGTQAYRGHPAPAAPRAPDTPRPPASPACSGGLRAGVAVALNLFRHGLPRRGVKSVALEKRGRVRHGKNARGLAASRGADGRFEQTAAQPATLLVGTHGERAHFGEIAAVRFERHATEQPLRTERKLPAGRPWPAPSP